MSERHGWGHSTYVEVVALAPAGVHNLILTTTTPPQRRGRWKDSSRRPAKLAADSEYPHYIDAAREGACYRLP